MAPETGNQKSIQNASIVARKATEKMSAGRSEPIRINLDLVRPDKGIDTTRTTQKDRKDLELERLEKGQPL